MHRLVSKAVWGIGMDSVCAVHRPQDYHTFGLISQFVIKIGL